MNCTDDGSSLTSQKPEKINHLSARMAVETAVVIKRRVFEFAQVVNVKLRTSLARRGTLWLGY